MEVGFHRRPKRRASLEEKVMSWREVVAVSSVLLGSGCLIRYRKHYYAYRKVTCNTTHENVSRAW